MFTQVQLRQLVPTGAVWVCVARHVVLRRRHRGERGRLHLRQAELRWDAHRHPCVGRPGVGRRLYRLSDDGRQWLIKEGKPTNSNEVFGFPDGAFSASLLGGDGSQEKKKAGGYETQGVGAGTCVSGAGNLHTNPVLTNDDPVSSTVCLPAFTITPGGLRLRILVDDHRDRDASFERLAQGARTVRRLRRGARAELRRGLHAGQLGHGEQGAAHLQDPRVGAQQPEDDHEGVSQRGRAAEVLRQSSVRSGLRRLDHASVLVVHAVRVVQSTHSPPSPRIWTVVADAPTNGPWSW